LTLAGDMGSSSRRTPVASWTALAITAPGRMIDGSPPPFGGESAASSITVSIFGSHEKRGSTYILDLGKINVQKLLGSGNINKQVEITVAKAVEKAVSKIENAGGKVVVTAADEDD